ncbi:MAG TPA: NUDIX hydrolase [Patescibacteria group bacterium]|nr:NUDIX hydrolase [Patescibacteria group bacterium]
MSLMQFFGRIIYWLAWPAYQVYYRFNDRTRVVLICGQEVLVLKQWLSDGRWSLPGGGLHSHEQPIAGALRETKEETGLQLNAKDLHNLGKGAYRNAGLHFNYYVFAGMADKTIPLQRQRHEVAELCWIPAASLTRQNSSPDLIYCLRLAREHHLLLQ